MNNNRESPDRPDKPDTHQQAAIAPVALILARFAPPQPAMVSAPPMEVRTESVQERPAVISETWDEARALEAQRAIYARLDAAVAAMPANAPHRQARLNVLANERGIVAGFVEKRDPILWVWLDSLELMLARWRETDHRDIFSERRTHHHEPS